MGQLCWYRLVLLPLWQSTSRCFVCLYLLCRLAATLCPTTSSTPHIMCISLHTRNQNKQPYQEKKRKKDNRIQQLKKTTKNIIPSRLLRLMKYSLLFFVSFSFLFFLFSFFLLSVYLFILLLLLLLPLCISRTHLWFSLIRYFLCICVKTLRLFLCRILPSFAFPRLLQNH